VADVTDLGAALSVLEGVLVGDSDLGISAPSPLLGLGIGVDVDKSITVVDGLFLGRALDSSDFLVDKRVVVRVPSTRNTGREDGRDSVVAEDTVVTDLCVAMSDTDNTVNQKSDRNGAFKLDNQIRGALHALDVEALGLKFIWVNMTNRIALNTGSGGAAGYGSSSFMVVSSTYKMSRIESLTGGFS
jgi:hypothetical protein